MKIYLGTDHAGFELKEALKAALTTAGHTVEDMGAHSYDAGDDYPDFVTPVAHAVAQDVDSFGIVLGGSGQGEAMCANRVPGVRTAVYYDGPMEIVRLAREHNNANILSLGARFVDEETAKEAVALFISTSFGNDERHARRLGKF
jgi:ribose 5-phosphate isomerase B